MLIFPIGHTFQRAEPYKVEESLTKFHSRYGTLNSGHSGNLKMLKGERRQTEPNYTSILGCSFEFVQSSSRSSSDYSGKQQRKFLPGIKARLTTVQPEKGPC